MAKGLSIIVIKELLLPKYIINERGMVVDRKRVRRIPNIASIYIPVAILLAVLLMFLGAGVFLKISDSDTASRRDL